MTKNAHSIKLNNGYFKTEMKIKVNFIIEH